ncbi:MAG: hypothetical protein OQK69_10710 [Gammaproteobacteria bacterium]|nr:hypothetical protein [Gammaproteobacteria bacterium]
MMNNAYPVPENLQHKIKSASDNRQPGQEIKIDAKKFVHIFREPLEKWLEQKALQNAQSR